MANTNEFWLTYHLASRAHLPATTQLIELEFQNRKLVDLEDVLDHVFRQGFVEAKHRPSTWWEKKDGQKVKNSHLVDDLIKQGVGKCQENALGLIVEDVPTTLWFSYHYVNTPVARPVTQRLKLTTLPVKFEKLAHVTNYIFKEGYLSAHLRPFVYWENTCGKRVEEAAAVTEILAFGEGTCEDKPLRLVINHDVHHHHAHPGPVCHAPEPAHDHHHHVPPFNHLPYPHHHLYNHGHCA
ncbi:hypothetical protein BDN72DRAFT_837912 [Pluteus cervinus]|uniref:Uncharacterized protein n=1 Tax=Pluteus cervinus TaxID=181527 RepID=A0ACD3B0E1_9AGAR|nr:hypothetical protein BDN72DRAFT_837912 [Pluteus cervinus]